MEYWWIIRAFFHTWPVESSLAVPRLHLSSSAGYGREVSKDPEDGGATRKGKENSSQITTWETCCCTLPVNCLMRGCGGWAGGQKDLIQNERGDQVGKRTLQKEYLEWIWSPQTPCSPACKTGCGRWDRGPDEWGVWSILISFPYLIFPLATVFPCNLARPLKPLPRSWFCPSCTLLLFWEVSLPLSMKPFSAYCYLWSSFQSGPQWKLWDKS